MTNSTTEETFVWEKKLQKQGLSNLSNEQLRAIGAQRVEENKVETLCCVFREMKKFF